MGPSCLLLFLDTSAINTKLPKAVYDMEADCSEVTSHGHHPLALSPDALSVGAYLLVVKEIIKCSKKATKTPSQFSVRPFNHSPPPWWLVRSNKQVVNLCLLPTLD